MFFDDLEGASESVGFGGFGLWKLGGASAGAVGTDIDFAEDRFCGDRRWEGAGWAVDRGCGGRNGQADHVAAE